MSVAKTSTCGAASAIVTPITPAPVPTSATRTARPSMRASAASTSASVVARGVKTRPGAVRKSSPWKVVSVRIGSWRIGMLISGAKPNGTGTARPACRAPATPTRASGSSRAWATPPRAPGSRSLMQGNTAEAREWFDRACERYRESWADAPPGQLGPADRDPQGARPRGRLGRGRARRALDARAGRRRSADADRPLRRRARARGARASGTTCASHADALREDDTFPGDVADALAAVASPDPIAYVEAVESVLESFETREAYLEDLPAADTVLVLQALAERRGLAPAELESELLPSRASRSSR